MKFLCHGNADPVDDLVASQEALRAARWWRAAEMEEGWPLTTEQAARLLCVAGQYDVDDAELADLIARGLIPRPGGTDDAAEWNAVDILAASEILEARHQWRPQPSQHDAKKHACELLLETARQNDELEYLIAAGNEGIRFDLRHLLMALTFSPNAEGRQKIAALLRAVLEVEHGIRI